MSSIFLCRNITRLRITLHHDANSSVATKVSLHIEVSFEGNVSDCAISPGSVNTDQILQNEIKASRDQLLSFDPNVTIISFNAYAIIIIIIIIIIIVVIILTHDINTIINNNNNNNNFFTIVSGSSQLFINIIKISLKIWIKFSVSVNQLYGLRRSRSLAEVVEKFNLWGYLPSICCTLLIVQHLSNTRWIRRWMQCFSWPQGTRTAWSRARIPRDCNTNIQ